MSPCPYPGYWGNQSLRESPVPALSVTVQCTRSTQGLSPIPSSFLTLSPGHIPIPATPLCGGCFPHRWGDPKEGSWRWEPHHLEMWNPGDFSKLLQPRGSTSFGCSRCSFEEEKLKFYITYCSFCLCNSACSLQVWIT